MISRQVLDNGKVTSVTKCKHFGFVQRKQNVSAMERGQQTNCQRTNLKPNPVEFAPGHSKCLALVRFGPKFSYSFEWFLSSSCPELSSRRLRNLIICHNLRVVLFLARY